MGRKLIIPETNLTITIEKINVSKHVVVMHNQRRSDDTLDRYSILARLHMDYRDKEWYGFVPLTAAIRSVPLYVANTYQESAEKAARNRTVEVFNSMDDALRAILNREF